MEKFKGGGGGEWLKFSSKVIRTNQDTTCNTSINGKEKFVYGQQGRSQKKILTEAMSMNNLWLRQSVHGWVLFLGIRYYKQQKPKKWPRQVPRLACY